MTRYPQNDDIISINYDQIMTETEIHLQYRLFSNGFHVYLYVILHI